MTTYNKTTITALEDSPSPVLLTTMMRYSIAFCGGARLWSFLSGQLFPYLAAAAIIITQGGDSVLPDEPSEKDGPEHSHLMTSVVSM